MTNRPLLLSPATVADLPSLDHLREKAAEFQPATRHGPCRRLLPPGGAGCGSMSPYRPQSNTTPGCRQVEKSRDLGEKVGGNTESRPSRQELQLHKVLCTGKHLASADSRHFRLHEQCMTRRGWGAREIIDYNEEIGQFAALEMPAASTKSTMGV